LEFWTPELNMTFVSDPIMVGLGLEVRLH
jgi:hypothetical protein